jgi:hypothetical protein
MFDAEQKALLSLAMTLPKVKEIDTVEVALLGRLTTRILVSTRTQIVPVGRPSLFHSLLFLVAVIGVHVCVILILARLRFLCEVAAMSITM